MSKVYILYRPERCEDMHYAYYVQEAVFASKEKAEQYLEKNKKWLNRHKTSTYELFDSLEDALIPPKEIDDDSNEDIKEAYIWEVDVID